eukprot:Gb_41530 [translate_table: standard]
MCEYLKGILVSVHDLLSFILFLGAFRVIALKRLSTSLEEESAIEAYQREVLRREAKAMKDLAALEQQLQVERDERSKEIAQYKDMENRLNSLHDGAQVRLGICLKSVPQVKLDSIDVLTSKVFEIDENQAQDKGKKPAQDTSGESLEWILIRRNWRR